MSLDAVLVISKCCAVCKRKHCPGSLISSNPCLAVATMHSVSFWYRMRKIS